MPHDGLIVAYILLPQCFCVTSTISTTPPLRMMHDDGRHNCLHTATQHHQEEQFSSSVSLQAAVEMQEAEEISSLVSLLKTGIPDQDRIRRLKSFVSSFSLSAAQAHELGALFEKCDAKYAIEGGVILCQSLTNKGDIESVLTAYKYEEDRKEITDRLKEA